MKKIFDNLTRFLGGEKSLSSISNSSDLVLAVIIIAIIMMLIFPVSPHVIDVLIAVNLTVSIALLFVALYIQKAVHLSMFPSLLLITTLYRLGVNISSTRQILLHHNAGKIIHAFGNFVVGGNYVVGGIVFLIITIVQFIVVTKGAERVAEVAARFTLDAMPGKQMAIDAELNAGVIDRDRVAGDLDAQLAASGVGQAQPVAGRGFDQDLRPAGVVEAQLGAGRRARGVAARARARTERALAEQHLGLSTLKAQQIVKLDEIGADESFPLG